MHAPNKRMQRNAKSVTIFAVAKTAPLFAPADARRYIAKNEKHILFFVVATVLWIIALAANLKMATQLNSTVYA